MEVKSSPAYLDSVRVQFRFQRLRLVFSAIDRLQFAAQIPANALRGALGLALQQDPDRYERVFAPRRTTGPSGFRNAPRPFVFRARELNGLTVQPGSDFSFAIHVFDAEIAPWIVAAFTDVAKAGLGPHRSRIALKRVEDELCDLDIASHDTGSLRIDFLTPTELKLAGRIASEPEFGPLIARACDRVSELSSLYGGGPLPIDFVSLRQRAAEMRMTACQCTTASASRVSSRTGQAHGLGGFIGSASYAGELGEFVPLLTVAQFTGVGRQTTWGKGEIQLHAHS